MPALISLGLAAAIAANAAIRTTQIEIPNSSQQFAIHCVEPSRPSRAGVLFIHGATFPTRLASGYEFSANDSWLAFVTAEGYLACGFDFVGFGASSRLAAMLETADRAAPGPVVPTPGTPEQSAKRGAWYAMNAEDRLERLHFRGALPPRKLLLDPRVDERWAREYAASSPIVAGDAPGLLRIPERPHVDLDAATAGELPYAPVDVRVPVFVGCYSRCFP